ncbi:MAG: hypothetical protein VKO39_07205 [Cyanobacteriota bacterium]|nr:hypothetical protein [Cyanobacteriota bacterium]
MILFSLVLLLAPGVASAQDEVDEDLIKIGKKDYVPCTECTEQNSRGGHKNTCYSVFADSKSPYYDPSFAFVPKNFSPEFATDCFLGRKTIKYGPICKSNPAVVLQISEDAADPAPKR